MFKEIPTYLDKNGNTVVFAKCCSVPGFTHRVLINRRAVDWLSNEYKPSAKTAEYFFTKHGSAA